MNTHTKMSRNAGRLWLMDETLSIQRIDFKRHQIFDSRPLGINNSVDFHFPFFFIVLHIISVMIAC